MTLTASPGAVHYELAASLFGISLYASGRIGPALGAAAILDVDRAGSVLVIKRSMAPGFAGIVNELYHLAHTTMLFGDERA